MDLLEKWDDIKNYFSRNKKKKKVKEEDPDDILEDESPNSPSAKGNTGLIPGIKRNWVRGGAIFLTLVFVLAVIYGTDLGEEEAKQTQSDMGRKADIPLNSKEDAKRATGNADNYQALLEENKRRQQQAAKNAQQNGQKPLGTVQAERTDANNPQQQQIPQPVRQQPVYAVPPQNPQQFANQYAAQQIAQAQQEEERKRQAQAAAEKAEADKLKNQYQSAIAFGMGSGMNVGNGGSAESGDGSATGSVAAQPTGYDMNASNASFAPVTGMYTAAAPGTIVAGTLIPVMLLTGINTDSPGQVMCQVQSDVYDYDGTNLLIPAGSRLLGSYDTQTVSNGRVSVTFSNLQTTDGGNWSLGNSIIAVDGAGYTGISGKVHHHTGAKISGGLMGSAIAALGSLAAGNASGGHTYSAGQIAAQGALANLIQTTSAMFNNAANIKNTVTVEPGYQFNVYVTNNISFM